MSNIILTPSQLWQNYDGETQPLKTSFLRYERVGDNYRIEAYITAFDTACGEVRAYVSGYRPADIQAPPTVIFVGDTVREFKEEDLLSAAASGMMALTFDYVGAAPDKKEFTKYPQDISYANYALAGDHLEKAVPSAEHTCIYQWVKVCRRAITFARTLTSNAKLALCGYGNGADICWLATGFDKRVTALTVMLSAGWTEMRNYPRYAKEGSEYILNDDSEGWLIGCASQVYAKYVSCPVMFVGTTNSDGTSIDRVDNTLQVVADGNVHCIFDRCANRSLSPQSVSTAFGWLKSRMSDDEDKSFPQSPTLELDVADNKLIAKYSADKSVDIKDVKLIYAKDEVISYIRYWDTVTLPAECCGEYAIPLSENNEIVFAYVTVTYEGDITLSSYMQIHRLTEENLEFEPVKRKTRLLYDKRQGISEWVVSGVQDMINPYSPVLDKGAMDIQGITAAGGDLTTFVLGTGKVTPDGGNLFRFDAYSEKARDICVEMSVVRDKKVIRYYACCHIDGGEWYPCTLDTSDFKDDKMIPLRSWDNMKQLTFKDISGMLLNNIMWV